MNRRGPNPHWKTRTMRDTTETESEHLNCLRKLKSYLMFAEHDALWCCQSNHDFSVPTLKIVSSWRSIMMVVLCCPYHTYSHCHRFLPKINTILSLFVPSSQNLAFPRVLAGPCFFHQASPQSSSIRQVDTNTTCASKEPRSYQRNHRRECTSPTFAQRPAQYKSFKP
jgi:hypothetical protein